MLQYNLNSLRCCQSNQSWKINYSFWGQRVADGVLVVAVVVGVGVVVAGVGVVDLDVAVVAAERKIFALALTHQKFVGRIHLCVSPDCLS